MLYSNSASPERSRFGMEAARLGVHRLFDDTRGKMVLPSCRLASSSATSPELGATGQHVGWQAQRTPSGTGKLDVSMKTQCVSREVEIGISRRRRRGLDSPICRELISRRPSLFRLTRKSGLGSGVGVKTGGSLLSGRPLIAG